MGTQVISSCFHGHSNKCLVYIMVLYQTSDIISLCPGFLDHRWGGEGALFPAFCDGTPTYPLMLQKFSIAGNI